MINCDTFICEYMDHHDGIIERSENKEKRGKNELKNLTYYKPSQGIVTCQRDEGRKYMCPVSSTFDGRECGIG